MGDAPRVEVLLATYNGERFLREQINSLLRQDYQDLTIIARDDGSSDQTYAILKEYERNFPNRFRILETTSSERGVTSNFISLMRAATADYVCFSDQDDVWLPEKVSKSTTTMEALESKWGDQTPLLVFSDLRVVNASLQVLSPSFWAYMEIVPERIHSPVEALGRGIVTGCTMLINRKMVDLALRLSSTSDLHDRWIAVLAATLGKAAFLPEPTVLYRQHGANAVGLGTAVASSSLVGRARRSKQSAREHIQEWTDSQDRAQMLLSLAESQMDAAIRERINTFRRCETESSRLVRIFTWISRRFYPPGILSKLAILSHLWRDRAGQIR